MPPRRQDLPFHEPSMAKNLRRRDGPRGKLAASRNLATAPKGCAQAPRKVRLARETRPSAGNQRRWTGPKPHSRPRPPALRIPGVRDTDSASGRLALATSRKNPKDLLVRCKNSPRRRFHVHEKHRKDSRRFSITKLPIFEFSVSKISIFSHFANKLST